MHVHARVIIVEINSEKVGFVSIMTLLMMLDGRQLIAQVGKGARLFRVLVRRLLIVTDEVFPDHASNCQVVLTKKTVPLLPCKCHLIRLVGARVNLSIINQFLELQTTSLWTMTLISERCYGNIKAFLYYNVVN